VRELGRQHLMQHSGLGTSAWGLEHASPAPIGLHLEVGFGPQILGLEHNQSNSAGTTEVETALLHTLLLTGIQGSGGWQ
jgi:hypothetical protein